MIKIGIKIKSRSHQYGGDLDPCDPFSPLFRSKSRSIEDIDLNPVNSVLQSRRPTIGTPQPLTRRRVCPLPLCFRRGEHIHLRERGWGIPIRTRRQCGTLGICTLSSTFSGQRCLLLNLHRFRPFPTELKCLVFENLSISVREKKIIWKVAQPTWCYRTHFNLHDFLLK